jgi:hypothetical protein
MGEHAHPTGTAWIWKIFWLLLAITAVEVVLGIVKPEFLMVQFAGTSLLNIIFIGLTLVKFEETFLQWTIYLPVLILIPYLLFILIAEGAQIYAA